MRKQFDISRLQWTDSDYLCPLCHMLLYSCNGNHNQKICVNPKCITTPTPNTLVTNVSGDPAVNQIKQDVDKHVKRFYIFNKKFLYCKLNEIRRNELHNMFTPNHVDIPHVLGVDFLLTKISHNTIWGTETNDQIFQNRLKEFLNVCELLSNIEKIESKMIIVDTDNNFYQIAYDHVIEDVRKNFGHINFTKHTSNDTYAFHPIDNKSGTPKLRHLHDFENMFKTSMTATLISLFKLDHTTSKIHNYPAEPSHFATLISLLAKCMPYTVNTITRDSLQELHMASVNKNKMSGDFSEFLQIYSSGIEFAPVLIFDGECYHFDYSTLFCFLLYIFYLNKNKDGTQTKSGHATYTQTLQGRACNFEATIREKMQSDGFTVLPQNGSKRCIMRAEGKESEFDCIAIDCSKKIIVLIEAKYEDISPSSASGETMLQQIVLDEENGLLHHAEKQNDRRMFLTKNFKKLAKNTTGDFLEYKKHSIIVTKFTPMIKRHKTTILMSFDEFRCTDFRNFDKG